jgi:hypothetical protein
LFFALALCATLRGPMPSPVSERCAHHSDRPGFALCMSCRKVVCQECATTWDGVNHCRACLASRGRSSLAQRRVLAWIACAAFCAAALFLAVRGLAWSTAMLARFW